VSEVLRLLAVLAHPDDESLGFGGTLVHYGAEGVETHLVTATLGQGGRFRGHPPGAAEHPGPGALAAIRERELRAACEVIGLRSLSLLGYVDGRLDEAPPREAIGRIAAHVRRVRPQVVMTFDSEGSYGHPDHIAISQFTTAALVAAADPAHDGEGADLPPHAVAKLYFAAWPPAAMDAYEAAFRKLVSRVDGVEREARGWPEWAVTTVIDTRACWDTVWRAVCCHESQVSAYEKLATLSPEHHEALWGWQSFYRAFSTVNGGRARETDLFEGLRNGAR
jgi:LmbE family N-acetylglucosaminyl deacetylase